MLIGLGSSAAPGIPSLAEMDAELQGLRQRLRSPRLRLADALGTTIQRVPRLLPAVARAKAAVFKGDAFRAQPPAS